MLWLSAIPAFAVAFTVIYAPGLLAGFLLRARGLMLFAIAPVVSICIICLFSFILPKLGVYWRPALVLPLILIITIVFTLVFRRLKFSLAEPPSKTPKPKLAALTIAFAVAIPSLVLTTIFFTGVPDPERYSTNFDNIFHLNAIRYVTETLNYSPQTILQMSSYKTSYYPDVWHLIISLVSQISGASIPLSINAVLIVTLLLIWPTGIIFLTKNMFGTSYLVQIPAASVASVMPGFPMLLTLAGPIYPNYLSYLLLPVSLTFLMRTCAILPATDIAPNNKGMILATIVTSAGAVAAHPRTFFVLLFALAAILTSKTIFAWTKSNRKTNIRNLVLCLCIYAAIIAAYIKLDTGEQRPATASIGLGIDEVLRVLSYSYGYAITGFAVLALIYGIIKRNAAIVALGILTVFFFWIFFISRSVADPKWRVLGVFWHSDWPRIAAAASIFIIPLSALGVKLFAEKLLGFINKFKYSKVLLTIVIIVLTPVLGIYGKAAFLKSAVFMGEQYHSPDAVSKMLTADEKAILDTLPKYLQPGQRIFGDPATGASLSYFYYGYPSIKPHMYGDLRPDEQLIWDAFDTAAGNPAVCEAIKRQNVYYALYFPGLRFGPEEYAAPGLAKITTAPGFELLEQRGDARLYRVTACQ